MADFNKEIQQRANTRAEINARHLTDVQITTLNKEIPDQLLLDLGIEVGENWKVPYTGYVPRLFMITSDKNGNEVLQAIDNTSIKPGTAEFWRQVQLGNVFAYPQDQKDPVQLQLEPTVAGRAYIHYSKPVDINNLPASPAKKPNFLKRFAHFVTGGRAYKNEYNAYYNKDRYTAEMKAKLSGMQEHRIQTATGNEKIAAQAAVDAVKAKQKQAADDITLEKALNNKVQMINGEDGMTSVYRPDPEFRDRFPYHKIEGKSGLYTKEQFDSLDVYGKDVIDLDKIEVGTSGETVTPTEFAAVTMFALWDEKIAPSALKHGAGGYDPHTKKSLQEAGGIPEKDADAVIAASARSMYTGDLFISNFRDNEGTYFKNTTNQGRKVAVDAFKDYAKGDNTKLAEIIATGINKAAKNLNSLDGTHIIEQDLAPLKMVQHLTNLMEKDPQLKDAALSAGMDPNNLKAAYGMNELCKLEQAERDAVYEITKAHIEGRELSADEKQKYAKDIMKSKFAKMNIASETNDISPDVMEKMANLQMNMDYATKDQMLKWNKNPESRPAPKPGKIWHDTAAAAFGSLKNIYQEAPKSAIKLGEKGEISKLDKLAEEACRQNDISNKPMDWMYKEFSIESKPSLKMTDVLMNAMNPKPQQPEQPKEQQPEIQRQNSKNIINENPERKGPEGPAAGGPTA